MRHPTTVSRLTFRGRSARTGIFRIVELLDTKLLEVGRERVEEAKTRAAAEEAERAAAPKAEQKAERDARYAARKAAKKVRRRGY